MNQVGARFLHLACQGSDSPFYPSVKCATEHKGQHSIQKHFLIKMTLFFFWVELKNVNHVFCILRTFDTSDTN